MPETETQVPESVAPEEEPLRPEYQIVPSEREEAESNFVPHPSIPANTGAPSQAQSATAAAPAPNPVPVPSPIKHLQKLTTNKTRVYAVIAVGFGLVVGLIVAVFHIHPGGPSATNEMDPVTVGTQGLKGHLTLKWGDRLAYNLTVEPSDQSLRSAFSSAVINSHRPLSLNLQLKDPFGTVLCGNTILVKFDPRNADLGVADEPTPRNPKEAEALAVRNQISESLNLARLENQELNREHGRDVFQNNLGTDGTIATISSQGTLPCSKQQYDRTASWGFTSDFPTVIPPGTMLPSSSDANSDANSSADQSPFSSKTPDVSKSSSDRKTRKDALQFAPRIYIEGDDAIVWYNATVGIVETSAGKALLVDRADTLASALRGREFPIDIHYRCDQSGSCTFAGNGLGIQHARLRR